MPLRELEDRRTTSDQIADALREAILTGEFADGEELNQVALAKHFGVSRVPLREALRQLQAEGLVDAKAHQRTVVSGLSIDRVVEILELRTLLESYLLGRAVPRMGDDDVARLRTLCTKMDKTSDHQAWLAENRAFHQALYEPADAPFTTDLIDQLAKRVERYLHVRSDKGIERNKEANREHWSIVEAIDRRDLRLARRELETHIAHTRERVEELFDDRTEADDAHDAAELRG